MKDLTSVELQNIDGGSLCDWAWGAMLAGAVIAGPLELPVIALAGLYLAM